MGNKTRRCCLCKEVKNIEEFCMLYGNPRNRKYSCKICETKRIEEWRKNNPEKFKLAQRRNNLKRNYGITVEQYEEMYKKQNGLCAVCGNEEVQRQVLSVDHDHNTNKVRGLLCHKCNRALGLLQDDVSIIKKMLGYLKRSL